MRLLPSCFALLLLAASADARAQAPDAPPARALPEGALPGPTEAAKPKPKPKPVARPKPSTPAALTPAKTAEPPARPQPSPSQGAFAAAPVVCDPGKAVLYDGPKGVALWVTRTGNISVDNPLKPLTPDVTRVLQVVIGGKVATAYGPDLNAVRRGGPPAALESLLGGPIRWDQALGTLPDSLDIVSNSGAALAELRFKECGDAPAARTVPVPKPQAEAKPKPRPKPPAPASAAAPGKASSSGGEPKPQFTIPRGAIPE